MIFLQQDCDDCRPFTGWYQLRWDFIHPALRGSCQENQNESHCEWKSHGQNDKGAEGQVEFLEFLGMAASKCETLSFSPHEINSVHRRKMRDWRSWCNQATWVPNQECLVQVWSAAVFVAILWYWRCGFSCSIAHGQEFQDCCRLCRMFGSPWSRGGIILVPALGIPERNKNEHNQWFFCFVCLLLLLFFFFFFCFFFFHFCWRKGTDCFTCKYFAELEKEREKIRQELMLQMQENMDQMMNWDDRVSPAACFTGKDLSDVFFPYVCSCHVFARAFLDLGG